MTTFLDSSAVCYLSHNGTPISMASGAPTAPWRALYTARGGRQVADFAQGAMAESTVKRLAKIPWPKVHGRCRSGLR
jgi:hypothetical protein